MFKVVIVGTDGSPSAGIAVERAIELARLSGSSLHVVHAFRSVDSDAHVRADSARVCADAVAIAARDGIEAFAHSSAGDPADVLVEVAREVDADVIVVG